MTCGGECQVLVLCEVVWCCVTVLCCVEIMIGLQDESLAY